MRVNRVEDPEGTLITIELIHTGNGNFKNELKLWIHASYPTWDFEDFFNRLITFQAGSCALDVQNI